MHLFYQHPLLSLLLCCCSWAAPSAQYAWGPYNDDWKNYIVKPAAPPTTTTTPTPTESRPRLMYRAGGGSGNNGTTPSFGGNGTYYGYGGANATGTGSGFFSLSPALSTSAPTAANLTGSSNATTISSNSSTIDTTCGITSPLYTLQVTSTSSGSGSAKNDSGAASSSSFDGWWVRLSGNSVLFTSQEAKATGFGVNAGTGHLCVPRRTGTGAGAKQRPPLIAIVETRLGTGPVWFLGADRLDGYEPEYEPVVCKGVGGGSKLTCSWGDMNGWSGCGLQLALGDGEGRTDGSLNCSSISVSASRS